MKQSTIILLFTISLLNIVNGGVIGKRNEVRIYENNI